jgi:hypothetical protein
MDLGCFEVSGGISRYAHLQIDEELRPMEKEYTLEMPEGISGEGS